MGRAEYGEWVGDGVRLRRSKKTECETRSKRGANEADLCEH